ncbi:MAG: Dabb family protein [Planctomycetota bacterium]
MRCRNVMLAVMLAATLLTGCQTTDSEAGQVDHVVLMWLKDPDDRDVLERIERTGRGFVGRIPGLTRVSFGQPLLDHPAIDNDYHAAFVMNFEDLPALEAYADHPLHRQAVDELLGPHVARLQVYDVLLR